MFLSQSQYPGWRPGYWSGYRYQITVLSKEDQVVVQDNLQRLELSMKELRKRLVVTQRKLDETIDRIAQFEQLNITELNGGTNNGREKCR